jgi:hypothetical protein
MSLECPKLGLMIAEIYDISRLLSLGIDRLFS